MCCTNASCCVPGTEQAIQVCTPKRGEMAQPRSFSGNTFVLHPVRLGAVSQPRRRFESYGFCRAKSFPVLSHWKFAEMVRRRSHTHGISYFPICLRQSWGVAHTLGECAGHPWVLCRRSRRWLAPTESCASGRRVVESGDSYCLSSSGVYPPAR